MSEAAITHNLSRIGKKWNSYSVNAINQGYSNINLRGPFIKFPLSWRSIEDKWAKKKSHAFHKVQDEADVQTNLTEYCLPFHLFHLAWHLSLHLCTLIILESGKGFLCLPKTNTALSESSVMVFTSRFYGGFFLEICMFGLLVMYTVSLNEWNEWSTWDLCFSQAEWAHVFQSTLL